MSESIVYIDRSDIVEGKLEELTEGILESLCLSSQEAGLPDLYRITAEPTHGPHEERSCCFSPSATRGEAIAKRDSVASSHARRSPRLG
jgi:hypothetical protein